MKFEKFLKGCGTYGQILERENGDKWLVCSGVGMKVPRGVVNLLGTGEVSEETKRVVEMLIKADTDDKVVLKRATVKKDGKAGDIVRVFGDDWDIEIGITNADFGLLEKSDVNLAEVEIEKELLDITKYLLVLDHTDEVIGFIVGTRDI